MLDWVKKNPGASTSQAELIETFHSEFGGSPRWVENRVGHFLKMLYRKGFAARRAVPIIADDGVHVVNTFAYEVR